MITKNGHSCVDASVCEYQSQKVYFSVWQNLLTSEAYATIHNIRGEEILSKKIGEKQFVTSSSYKTLSLSLRVLEVCEQTHSCPYNSFLIKLHNLTEGTTTIQTYLPTARYEQFVSVKEIGNKLVLAFVVFKDEFNESPRGVTLVELDSNLKFIRKVDHLSNRLTSKIIDYFCATTTKNEIAILFEDEMGDAILFRYSLESFALINVRPLVPAQLGFGYIRVMSFKDGSLFLISVNWTLFQVDLYTLTEVMRERLRQRGDQIPNFLFWDEHRWLAGRVDGYLGKIQNNAHDFILSAA